MPDRPFPAFFFLQSIFSLPKIEQMKYLYNAALLLCNLSQRARYESHLLLTTSTEMVGRWGYLRSGKCEKSSGGSD